MVTPRRTQSQWQAIINSYQASGLSGVEYCRREGIHPKSFYRAKSTYSSKPSPKAFIQATPRVASSTEIILVLPNCKIQCSSDVSPQWIAQLVNVLYPKGSDSR